MSCDSLNPDSGDPNIVGLKIDAVFDPKFLCH